MGDMANPSVPPARRWSASSRALAVAIVGAVGLALALAFVAGCADRVPPPEGPSALHRAAAQGDTAGLGAELRAGVDPDARDALGRTALALAAEAGHVDAVEILVAAGADLDRATRGPGSALEAAKRAGHVAVAAALLRSAARAGGTLPADRAAGHQAGGDSDSAGRP
jgi:ankyrin repeat protein